MKRSIVTCTMVVGALLVALLPSSAFAICPRDQILQHAVGGYFTNCPDARPVKAYAYAVNSTAAAPINSGSVDIACEDAASTNGQASPCQPEAGLAGDGNVTILFDWGGGGTFSGCPNPQTLANTGRNVVQVVANDGSSLVVSVGFSPDLQQYPVDFAEVPGGATGSQPLSCSRANSNGGVQIASLDATQLCVNMIAAKLYTDCDTGTWGTDGGPVGFTPTCDPASMSQSRPGKL